MIYSDGARSGNWWVQTDNGARIECQLCPRRCSLKPGDRGFCFVRENRDGDMVLSTYGKSTGFCIDPIEKKPLNHFYPGSAVLSFGTAGCNLGCKFCQNWDISKSREVQRLSADATPAAIAQAAHKHACTSVAYTYNDPVIWAEYAIDTAIACRDLDIRNVAVTAGYIEPDARVEFFRHMDAANVDLKAFTEDFYQKITYSHLQPVLDTLVYLQRETSVWFEVTNLIIPDANDNPDELRKMCDWLLDNLGDQVPIHFTAFHPDFRMTDRGSTDPATLVMAQEIARSCGLRFAYVGNTHDAQRQSTYCPSCGELLIERDWYTLGTYRLNISDSTGSASCPKCDTRIAGRFSPECGTWGSRRQPIMIEKLTNEPASATAVPGVLRMPPAGRSTPAEQNADQKQELLEKQEVRPVSGSLESDRAQATPQPSPAAAPKLLDITRVGTKQWEAVRRVAANHVCQAVAGTAATSPEQELGDLSSAIIMGAFVTLKRGDVLRGCCGVLGKPIPLGHAVAAAAAKTAREDQRMAAISPSELPFLNLEVTLLGPFQQIKAEGTARAESVNIGKHGLMIQRAGKNGLLLPSVAVERGWNSKQFLQAVCTKAGLPIASWSSPDANVFTFDGESESSPLSEFLPTDLPKSRGLPLTVEQLHEYARAAGQNIAALVSGGTPSYVLPGLPDATVNALVLSMQWTPASDAAEPSTEGAAQASEQGSADAGQRKGQSQGNLLQVSYRPGVPLQSTLYQLCQQAALLFQRQSFTGQFQLGLTVGFDPAMHGFGKLADLEGIDTAQRGLVISDPRHCALAFHPEKSVSELQDQLRALLPISSRDAALHSLQILSTMPHVISVSTPSPVDASGQRPAAVAGKFYPAEDAARRAMVGTFFKEEDPPQSSPLAIMVPHAGIKYSGKVAAQVWRRVQALSDKPIVIISPKHTPHGVNWAACPFSQWRLSGTTVIDGSADLAKGIAAHVTPIQMDAAAHQHEHGIEVQLPFLERLAPQAQVVGLALNGGSWEDIQSAASEFAAYLRDLPELPLLVISSDMNHYAPDEENRRRDRLALDAMATGDPETLIESCRQNEISMCGQVPAAFVMETLRQLELPFRVEEVAYATSAEVSGDKSQVVGYAGSLLLPA